MSVTWTIHKGGPAYNFLETLEDALVTETILSDSADKVAIGGGGNKVVFAGAFVDSDPTDEGPESGTVDTIKVYEGGVLVATATGYSLDLDDFEDPFDDLPDFSTFHAFFFDNPEQTPFFIMGSAGKDALTAGSVETEIFGKGGNDKLTGSDIANDYLDGGAGNDKIYGNGNGGGVGRDELFGGKGDDWIAGNAGIDWVTGGKGKDEFYIALANGNNDIDIIFDFRPGVDKIVLSSSVFGAIGAKLNASELIFMDADDTPGDDYINYNPSTGTMFFFAEGREEGEVGLSFVRLDNTPTISHTDFVII
jgi:Ca2+-binding RTX toxin-like protein